jgi:putative nucleotidyltransferase with HDIG domain
MEGVRRQLPFAVLGTLLVVVLPALLVTVLPGGPLPAIGACLALSLAVSRGASALWGRFPRSRDLIFADLMLWGYLRRLRTERRLEHVRSLVVDSPDDPVEMIKDVRALQQVTTMLESRDAYTRRHSLRVTRHCEGIARGLGLSEEEVARVRTAATLHDLGKFFTPREVLNKPGRLTDEEFAIVKRHPADGAALLHGVVEPEVIAMIRHHHERLGGNGYPDGLGGDAIPLGARIIAVADTFDAITSTRAYRTARPHAKALEVLREESGVALDARAVAAFRTYYSGRRGTAWSGLASSLTVPLRELITAGTRALPAVGAGAALAASGAGGAVAASRVPSNDAAKAKVVKTAAAPRARATAATLRRARETRRREHKTGLSHAKVLSPRPVPGSRGRPNPLPHRPSRPHPGAAGGQPTPTAPAADPQPTAAPATPAPATPAPTQAPPAVTVPSVTVEVGDVEVVTPPVVVELPDLPVHLPPLP